MRIGSLFAVFFTLLFTSQAAIADAPLKARLGLDMDQAKSVDEIQARYRKAFRAKRGPYHREQRALRRAKKANDGAAVAKHEPVVAALKAELRDIILTTDDEVRAVLTPTQLAKFEAYILERNAMVGSSRDVRVLDP